MTQKLDLVLKSSIFSGKKLLTIDPDFVAFGEVSFSKFEVGELRYGVKSIHGYRVRIGRIYCIDIKSVDGRIIKIRLTSVYRINRALLGKKYKQVVEAVFDNFISEISLGYIKRFNDKIDFALLGNTFTQDGITLPGKTDTISWLDLGTKAYCTYYSIFSVLDPYKNKSFYYLTDWNTIVLYNVSREILKSKNLL